MRKTVPVVRVRLEGTMQARYERFVRRICSNVTLSDAAFRLVTSVFL
jgi:hypothetical protein